MGRSGDGKRNILWGWPNVDFGRICEGRERESEKTAHVGRITKIVGYIRIVFGLPSNWRWFKSHSSQAVRLAQYLLRDSSGVTFLTTWSNPQYNTELFYFSVWAFEKPNKRARIYHERACEREYISEYRQRNENW